MISSLESAQPIQFDIQKHQSIKRTSKPSINQSINRSVKRQIQVCAAISNLTVFLGKSLKQYAILLNKWEKQWLTIFPLWKYRNGGREASDEVDGRSAVFLLIKLAGWWGSNLGMSSETGLSIALTPRRTSSGYLPSYLLIFRTDKR